MQRGERKPCFSPFPFLGVLFSIQNNCSRFLFLISRAAAFVPHCRPSKSFFPFVVAGILSFPSSLHVFPPFFGSLYTHIHLSPRVNSVSNTLFSRLLFLSLSMAHRKASICKKKKTTSEKDILVFLWGRMSFKCLQWP